MMDNCPKCDVSWVGQDIMEYFQDEEIAGMYGWTPDNPKHFSVNVVMVEYPDHYDGASEIQCKVCGTRIGRFSGKYLAGGETERM